MSDSIKKILDILEDNNREIISSHEIFNWENSLVEDNLQIEKILERINYLLPIDIEREIRSLPDYVWRNEEIVKEALKGNVGILAYLPIEIEKECPEIFTDATFVSALQKAFRNIRVTRGESLLKERIKNIQNFMETHILNNEKTLIDFLKNSDFSVMEYVIKHDLLTPEVQNAFWSAIEKRPLNRLSEHYEWVGQLPQSFFKNHEVLAYSFLFSKETLEKYPSFHDLLPASLSEQLTIIEKTDKNLLIEIYHKSAFKNDPDLIEALMTRNPRIYEYLPDSIRHCPQVIFKHLSNHPQNVSFIMKELLAQDCSDKILACFSNAEDIDKLISLYPEVLKSEASPATWHTKEVMLRHARYHEFFRNQEDWVKLSSDKESCLFMLQKSSLLYQSFAPAIQNQAEVGLTYLMIRNGETKHMGKENGILLSPELMQSPGFAIEAILFEPEAVKLLDEKWWDNKKFVMQFFRRLDQYHAENDNVSHILVWLPSYVTTFFESLGADGVSDTRFTDVLERTLLVQNFEATEKPLTVRKKSKI